MKSIKKSIDERALHKREYDTRVNERHKQTKEGKVETSKALDASLVDTERSRTQSENQDTSNKSGNDIDADNAYIKLIYNEEPMAVVQLTVDNNVFATRQQHIEPPAFNNKGEDIDDLETINIELEYSVTTLLKENKYLKKTYKDLYDSIKKTRVQTKDQNDSLIEQLNKKSIENANLKTQIQEKVFANATLKNELRKLKGNNVVTKFAKPSILGKPVLHPLRNQSVVRQPTAFKSKRPRISKPLFASQVDVKNDLSKPLTPHYLPKVQESAL
ncbi:hypothetical protein Tco_0429561 [Tanacetum coccineum]